MTTCEQKTVKQGDCAIVPIEYEQGALQSINGWSSFDKIEIIATSDLSTEFVFSTEKTDDYAIDIIDDNNMELIIPSEATTLMLGEIQFLFKYYFEYKTKPIIDSEEVKTNLVVIE